MVDFRGKPLIQYTLDAISEAAVLSDVLVSSDDSEILDYCSQAGFHSNYRRPQALGADDTSMIDVVLDGLSWFEAFHGSPDFVVLLQPTSPLRDSRDLCGFVEVLHQGVAPSVISAHRMIEHPMECLQVEPDGKWNFLVPPPSDAFGRQSYQGDFLFINGAIYAATPAFLRERRSFLGEGLETRFYVMDSAHGLDIDTPEDLLQ